MSAEEINLSSSLSSPAIRSSWGQGCLYLQGDSYPENAYEFYKPVFDWIHRFLAETDRALELELRLLYLNTSSIKALMDILDIFEVAHKKGREVTVYWYYDSRNERVFELAEEFREDCSFPFHIVST
jgi:hypothetical protein